MQIVLISGLSGSGKSIVLKVLEDAAYYAVDNLPVALLPELVAHLRAVGCERLAVAVDVRAGSGLADLPQQIARVRNMESDTRLIFLNARDDTLIARFSETRRRHPLASGALSVVEAIHLERDALAPIAELGHNVDTSDLHPNTLRAWVKDFIAADPAAGLTLMFQSFGFKFGIPLDADLVFDVRCLPNPHYDPKLRPLTGRDQPVIDFLQATPEVVRMGEDIRRFVADWLPSYRRDNRNYLTVAIGCTGGQHRSVYLAEWLARQFDGAAPVMVRHRSVDVRAETASSRE